MRSTENKQLRLCAGGASAEFKTAPWTVSQGIKDSSKLHTSCFTYKHTNKPKSCLKIIFQLFSILAQTSVSGLHHHMRVAIQTFSGGCDVLGSHLSRLFSSSSPTHEGQPQGVEVHLSSGQVRHIRNLALKMVKCL